MTVKILVVDDEKTIRDPLRLVLQDEGYSCAVAENGKDALEIIRNENIDIVISDIKMPEMDGIEMMQNAAKISPETFCIIMTAYASVNTAIDALRLGAYDYLLKPIEFDDLVFRIKRLLQFRAVQNENKILRQRITPEADFTNIIGSSAPMKRVFKLIRQVAPTNSNVLIYGKSGTGKEMAAKAIHYNSLRKDKIFLPINCGAISENLIESELFGHKKGSFTGATEEKQGLFKVADGGTLFLDEIGDLPLNMQVKLLRALEEKLFLPVGGTKPIKTDVRIIAATNQDLVEKMKNGEFREDLFYRLNVVEINLPNLNERKEDIPLLVNHFIEKYCSAMGKRILGVDNETMRTLMGHDWKGGVRELENVVERAVIFAEGETIIPDDLSDHIRRDTKISEYPESLKEAIHEFEKVHIKSVIKKFNFNKEEAARALNIGLSSLYRKMEELGIPTKMPKE